MNVFHADITESLGDVISLLLSIFKYSYQFMRGIEFFGTNLFSFTITVFILLVLLPILFTLVRSEAVHNQNFKERVNKLRNRRNGD